MPDYQKSFEAHEKPVYYYKLNENYKGAVPASIEGVLLHKEWKGFKQSQPKLAQFLRTYKNSTGMIDMKVEDMTKKVYSNTEIDFTKKRVLHTREVLTTFKRKVLEDIARQWNIDTVNKRDPFLINLIAEKQDEYVEFQKELKKNKKSKEDNTQPDPEQSNVSESGEENKIE
jgi:hypothetical protein